MDRKMVAAELVRIAEMLVAEAGFTADPEAVEKLTGKLISRLGQAKTRKLSEYGLNVKSSDTVEQLAKAWATVLLGA